MRRAIAATMLAASLLVSSVTAASAWDNRYWDDHYDGYRDHRGPGPVLGFFGQIAAGALTIATAPLALLGGGRDRGHHGYYNESVTAPTPEIARDYYGTDARFYGSPPRYSRFDDRW